MSTVLVLGVGPLPVDPTSNLHAPGLRTWHIAELLARKRHRIMLGVIDFGDFQPGHEPNKGEPRREEAGEFITISRLTYDPTHLRDALYTLHRAYNFDCIVSTTDIMNAVAGSFPARIPTWLDYNGDPFAEKQ